jgi:hypothetical protein
MPGCDVKTNRGYDGQAHGANGGEGCESKSLPGIDVTLQVDIHTIGNGSTDKEKAKTKQDDTDE